MICSETSRTHSTHCVAKTLHLPPPQLQNHVGRVRSLSSRTLAWRLSTFRRQRQSMDAYQMTGRHTRASLQSHRSSSCNSLSGLALSMRRRPSSTRTFIRYSRWYSTARRHEERVASCILTPLSKCAMSCQETCCRRLIAAIHLSWASSRMSCAFRARRDGWSSSNSIMALTGLARSGRSHASLQRQLILVVGGTTSLLFGRRFPSVEAPRWHAIDLASPQTYQPRTGEVSHRLRGEG
mmetsp:Transcript_42086/g.123195  ORF Transcript_42086/g.123195 Transcript_42086/m.123195 type:complete len:238 (+) Transcript_42086:267-980(+)